MKRFFHFLWRYKIYTIIVIILVGLISFSSWKKANTPPKLNFDKVSRENIIDSISESGNVYTKGQANIFSSIEGVVNEILVSDGQWVSENAALFRVKSSASELEKSAAYASLLSAATSTNVAKQTKITLEAALETAQKQVFDAQRAYEITESGFRHRNTNPATSKTYKQIEVDSASKALTAAQETLAAATLKVNDADSAIQAAQSSEDSARLNYESKNIFTVRAPRAGKIANLAINIGDKVGSAATQASSEPSVIITNSNDLIFKTQINEIDIAKLNTNQNATISIDAVKNQNFKGRIDKIDEIGTNTQGVITFNVYFSIENIVESIRPGMSGNVDVEVARHENALTVSNAAIKPYQDGKAVQVIDTSKPTKNNQPEFKYIPIKTGIKGSERTEILEGLTEGTEVIINNTGNQFKSNIFGG